MELRNLDPSFIKRISEKEVRDVPTIEQADGLMFLCPKCLSKDKGSHYIICWNKGVPPEETPKGGRWHISGTSLLDVSLSPSVHLESTCGAHFFVQKGIIS